jgi:hypothetical protein
MTRIKMMVHKMIFLLMDVLNLQLIANWSFYRVAVALTVQYDENSGDDGKYRQDQAQAT